MDTEQDTVQVDLLHKAFQALSEGSGLQIEQVPVNEGPGLALEAEGQAYRFAVKLKPNLTRSAAALLLQQDKVQASETGEGTTGEGKTVIVSDHIASSVAALFRQHDQCYLDAAGNAYLHDGALFVLIEGRKRTQRPYLGTRNRPHRALRAFQEAGLRLLFTLLLEPERITHAYRALAERAGISRGAVGYVMADLMALEFAVELANGRRKLLRREALLEKWVVGYAETLRPRLLRGRFRFKDAEQHRHWREIPLKSTGSLWGGEPAADLLTQQLRPEVFTLYTDVSQRVLVRETKLVPDPEGVIEVLRPFWKPEAVVSRLPALEPACVPPLLVYADLIASAASRNLAVAQRLYRAYLSEPTKAKEPEWNEA